MNVAKVNGAYTSLAINEKKGGRCRLTYEGWRAEKEQPQMTAEG